MYHPIQLASFALMHLEYFLEGLSDDDARRRVRKEDGTEMNSISWIVAHVASQWLLVAAGAAESTSEELADLRRRAHPYRTGSDDPTPPSLEEALNLLHSAREMSRWIVEAKDDLMASLGRDEFFFRPERRETLGTRVMRASLHTLIHAGEIVAIRQVLGLPERGFVANMDGNMEWLAPDSSAPAWVEYQPVTVASR